MKTLEDYARIYDEKTSAVKEILNEHRENATLWIKNENSFYILSKSAKEEGYQLTYFINNEPISDKIRVDLLDCSIVEELALNDCFLKRVV